MYLGNYQTSLAKLKYFFTFFVFAGMQSRNRCYKHKSRLDLKELCRNRSRYRRYRYFNLTLTLGMIPWVKWNNGRWNCFNLLFWKRCLWLERIVSNKSYDLNEHTIKRNLDSKDSNLTGIILLKNGHAIYCAMKTPFPIEQLLSLTQEATAKVL